MRLKGYLTLEEAKKRTEIVEGDNLKCEVCGRIVKVYEQGKGPLICCGKEMKII